MRSYSESIKILHPIYDSLICFKSVKSQEIDYKKEVKVLQFVTHYLKCECVNLNLGLLEKKETQKILKIER